MIAGIAIVAALAVAAPADDATGERWRGVDEAVVARVAAEAGRRSSTSPFEPEGDLKLFCFLTAGVAGGFALGYGWREIFGGARARRTRRESAP